MSSLRPPAFERLVAPARTRPQLGRLVLGFFLVELGFVVGSVILLLTFGETLLALPAGAVPDADTPYATTPAGVVVALLAPALLILWTWAAASVLQRRTLRDLAGPLDPRLFLGAAGITVALAAAAELLVWDLALAPGVPFATLLAWAPVALPVLALQTGGEELFYRGYLQTQLAARFAAPAVWLGLPAALFALVHVDVWHLLSEGAWADNDGIWAATIFASGLIAGDLTRVTGGLAAAWGWHFGTNLFALFVVSPRGDASGLALWQLPFGLDDPVFDWTMAARMILLQVILWAVLRLWLARRGLPD